MVVILVQGWLLLKENTRANQCMAESYQQVVVESAEINWTPTYVIIQDAQGRGRARGTIYPIYTVFDTEVK